MIERRLVAVSPSLIPVRTKKPNNGEKVLALTHGRRLVEVIWTSRSHLEFDAYMPYPSVPDEVKQLQWERFSKTGEFAVTVQEQDHDQSSMEGDRKDPASVGDECTEAADPCL